MKRLMVVLIIAALFCCSFALVACNNTKPAPELGSGDGIGSGAEIDNNLQDGEESGDSADDGVEEKVVVAGVLSESVYDSAEDAVKGFLEEEISGTAFTAVYVGYTKLEELSQDKIDELDLDDDTKNGLVSVEKGEVEYVEQSSEQPATLARGEEESCKRVVYIVKCKLGSAYTFRFYAPEDDGQSILKSVFKSLTDSSKYINSTVELNVVIEAYDEIVDYLMRYTNDAAMLSFYSEDERGFNEIYCYYDNPYLYEVGMFYDGEERICTDHIIRTGKITIEELLLLSDDTIGKIEVNIANSVASIPVFVILSFLNSIDYSTLSVTDSGYELREKYKQHEDEEFTITVSNNMITDICWVFYDDYGKTECNYSFSNFGTTEIDVLQEVIDSVEEYKSNNQ